MNYSIKSVAERDGVEITVVRTDGQDLPAHFGGSRARAEEITIHFSVGALVALGESIQSVLPKPEMPEHWGRGPPKPSEDAQAPAAASTAETQPEQV